MISSAPAIAYIPPEADMPCTNATTFLPALLIAVTAQADAHSGADPEPIDWCGPASRRSHA